MLANQYVYDNKKKHIALIESFLVKQRKENKTKESISCGLISTFDSCLKALREGATLVSLLKLFHCLVILNFAVINAKPYD